MPENPIVRMQELLRELFQFDCQDLDFGVYRVLNYRRKQIEEFIGERLPQVVDEAFTQYAAADKAAVERELEEKRHEIVASLGATAFDATEQLVMAFRETPLGKLYIELEQKAKVGHVAEELKAGVYNDLYTFFSRYYEDGDVFSKPRRGKVEIPFTGHEDVVLHWANKDQYYIKTGEQFKSYRFTVDKQAVQFTLRNAATEQNNNQREKRYFVLAEESPVVHDNKAKTLTVFFEYRPLTNAEKKSFGKTENQKPQDKLNAVAEDAIHKRVKDATLKGRLAQPVGDGKPGLLRYHLNRFTKKNSTDFFIHRNLRGFLERELDDFLKTEVLRVDELLATGGTVAAQQLARGRVVREIAVQIIAFLAQIEDFQKKLFEKRKFVVRTEYCVTLDRLPEAMWDDVLKNEAQLAEWRELYAITKKKPDKAFLKEHDKLVVDTRHFPEDFKWRLLAAFDDLDTALNGLLIKSENFQALALLLAKYRERVKCTYIDPPYNTSASAILYKNNYRHSSWATLMRDRLAEIWLMMRLDGAIFVSIDKTERTVLEAALDDVFGVDNRIEELIWAMNTNNSQAPNYSTNHEYVLVYARDRLTAENDRNMFREPKPGYAEVMELVEQLNPSFSPISEIEAELRALYERHKMEYRAAVEAQGLEWDAEKGNDLWKGLYNYCHAEYRDENGEYVPEAEAKKRNARIWVWREGDISMPATKQSESTRDPKHLNFRFYKPKHPVTHKPVPIPRRGWNCPYEGDSPESRSFKSLDRDHRIIWGEDEIKVPQLKRILHEAESNVGKSVFTDYSDGEKQTFAMFGKAGLFLAPKHADFVSRFIQHAAKPDSIMLDCFGGSGSTAHAVIALNREDRGKRKYILAEVGDYFDTLLKPRVCKAVYSPTWKDGKPTSESGGISHFMKYHYLESNEDALNNIEAVRAKEGELALKRYGDEYLLRYMLDFETAGSTSLLSVKQLRHPFDYRLKVQEGDEIVERPVDVVETFNYLLGLHVKKLREVYDGKRRYRVTLGESRTGKSVVVVWRDMDGLEGSKEALQRDRQFVEGEILPALLGKDAKPDRLLVNQPYAGEAEPIEPEFKRLMFAPIG